MNIKIVDLKGPGTILSKIEETEDKVVLYRPVEVMLKSDEKGDFFVSFIPFLHFAKEHSTGITIDKSEILCILNPQDDILDHYSSLFKDE